MSISHENLSKAVAAILESTNVINVDQRDCQVVASSFEPVEDIRPLWELAIKVARELADWTNEDCAAQGDWSMNLFTVDGLWTFPESGTQ